MSELSQLPKDPVILLSYINTKLRDEYPTLDELCGSLCVSREELEERLSSIGYAYDTDRNCFR